MVVMVVVIQVEAAEELCQALFAAKVVGVGVVVAL
jgi:hypothetical protein